MAFLLNGSPSTETTLPVPNTLCSTSWPAATLSGESALKSGFVLTLLAIRFVLCIGFGHALLCPDSAPGLVGSGQLYAGRELPQYQSPDKIREGLTAGLFGCTIGGNMAVQDGFDINV